MPLFPKTVGSAGLDEQPAAACESKVRRSPLLAWPIVLPAAVLVAAIAVQNVKVFRQAHVGAPPHLAQAIPSQVAGWSSRELPLGANEFLSDVAEKVLNYDDVVFREFSRGGERFQVYVAYWGAGKMPTRMVASHTPDRCWTENGWQCLSMKFKQPETVGTTPLKPAEWRLFQPPSGEKPVYVMYWHLVEGHLYDYGSRFNQIPDPVLWWKDAVQQAVLGSREQYFIRLTSDEPLESLWNEPGFSVVVGSLAKLGLADPAGKP
jgi:hypothetical protein